MTDLSLSFTSLVAVVLAAVTLTCTSCGSSTGPDSDDGGGEINDDLIKLEAAPSDYPFWWMGAWTSRDEIYATAPLSRLHLSDSLSLRSVSTLIKEGAHLYAEADGMGKRLLVVRSLFIDASVGTLFEMDAQTGRMHTLRDSSYAVSSAVYLPGSNSRKLVYYSYGSDPEFGNEAKNLTSGYYLYDKATGVDSLLFAHRSELGPGEVINGFDVSPDGRTILYPIPDDWSNNDLPSVSPRAVEYDFRTSARDTLNFDFTYQLLWLRYHPSGDYLIYGNYPRGAGGYTSYNTGSEIGVVNLHTLERRVLDVDTNQEDEKNGDPNVPSYSMSVFPKWGPLGRHIMFGSAQISRQRAVGSYSLYILKNVK